MVCSYLNPFTQGPKYVSRLRQVVVEVTAIIVGLKVLYSFDTKVLSLDNSHYLAAAFPVQKKKNTLKRVSLACLKPEFYWATSIGSPAEDRVFSDPLQMKTQGGFSLLSIWCTQIWNPKLDSTRTALEVTTLPSLSQTCHPDIQHA